MTLDARIEESAPHVVAVRNLIDRHLSEKFPEFFKTSANPLHPILDLKPYKIIHDNVWGTNQYNWRELSVIDSPILQRLRDIHQTGLAYLVYPSARHSRFEHCLGTLVVASRIFDGLRSRQYGELQDIAKAAEPALTFERAWAKWRSELRIASLLHDTGHCLHSHTSERVYGNLDLLKKACQELHELIGKRPHAGEVISYCFATSDSLKIFLDRCAKQVMPQQGPQTFDEDFDLEEAALMILGRTKHPFTQFLADAITSGYDADKLDYLQRDALSAGIPIAFDIDRYFFFARIEKIGLGDGEGRLEQFYASASKARVERVARAPGSAYPGYEANRLRLPRQAMTVLQQIVVSKLMLFSYIYHHPKIRAAEGMVERALMERAAEMYSHGKTEEDILLDLLALTDSCLYVDGSKPSIDTPYGLYANRLTTRVLPREVYRFNSTVATHAAKAILRDYLSELHDPDRKLEMVAALEKAIGEELISLDPKLGATFREALLKTGSWFDVPREPGFEDIDELIVDPMGGSPPVKIRVVFPIGEWTQAYVAYEYWVRIYAFSEFKTQVERAARLALERVIGVHGDDFFKVISRFRN